MILQYTRSPLSELEYTYFLLDWIKFLINFDKKYYAVNHSLVWKSVIL